MLEDEKFDGFVDLDDKSADHPLRKKLALVLSTPHPVQVD